MQPEPNQGSWPDERPRVDRRWAAILASICLVFIGGFSILCVGGLAGAVPLLMRHGFDPADLMTGMTGDLMALTFFSGFGSFAVLGTLLAVALGWKTRHALGLRGSPWAGLLIAALGGLVVGLFPGWIAQQLFEAFPHLADQGTLEIIPRILTEGTLFERGALILTIVVGAPILEEVCFRGLLWNALERILPGWGGQVLAMVLTSLAFVIAHADLVQSTALIFTAFFLGWLRMTTGSLWPGVIAHFVNNGLAAVLTVVAIEYGWEEESSSVILALVGATLTVGMAVALWPLRRKPEATPETAWAALSQTDGHGSSAQDLFEDLPTDPSAPPQIPI